MSSIAIPRTLSWPLYCTDEAVALLSRVVEVERRARRRRHVELRHQQLVAVVSGAHAHAFPVEDLGHVVGMYPLDVEGHDANTVVERLRTVDRDARHVFEPRQDVASKEELM